MRGGAVPSTSRTAGRAASVATPMQRLPRRGDERVDEQRSGREQEHDRDAPDSPARGYARGASAHRAPEHEKSAGRQTVEQPRGEYHRIRERVVRARDREQACPRALAPAAPAPARSSAATACASPLKNRPSRAMANGMREFDSTLACSDPNEEIIMATAVNATAVGPRKRLSTSVATEELCGTLAISQRRQARSSRRHSRTDTKPRPAACRR